MKLSNDGLYQLFCDCANDLNGATVAVWDSTTKQPHPDYPGTAEFLTIYESEIPEPEVVD